MRPGALAPGESTEPPQGLPVFGSSIRSEVDLNGATRVMEFCPSRGPGKGLPVGEEAGGPLVIGTCPEYLKAYALEKVPALNAVWY